MPYTTMIKSTVVNEKDVSIWCQTIQIVQIGLFIPVRLILQCGLYSSVASTPVWLMLQCEVYSSVAYTPVWLVLHCGLYSIVAYTPVWLVLLCGLYPSVAYTPVWLIFQCGLTMLTHTFHDTIIHT